MDGLEIHRENYSISVKSTVQFLPLGQSTFPGHLVGVFLNVQFHARRERRREIAPHLRIRRS